MGVVYIFPMIFIQDVAHQLLLKHNDDVIMGAMASQITSPTIVYSTVYSGADQSKHQSSASLAFVWGPVNSPHKWPVTRKMVPFDDVIMQAHSCTDILCRGARASIHKEDVVLR